MIREDNCPLALDHVGYTVTWATKNDNNSFTYAVGGRGGCKCSGVHVFQRCKDLNIRVIPTTSYFCESANIAIAIPPKETAGSLREGRVCWALLNQGTSKIMKGDSLKQYLLLQWGHTGCDSIRCGLTSIRVVCNNTLQQALRQDAATLHAVSHNKHTTVKLSEIRDMYDKVQEEFKKQEKIFKEFLDVPIDENTKSWYINELLDGITNLPDTAGKTEEEQEAQMKRYTAMRERKESLIRLYIEEGSGQKELGITNNLWGLFNGAEEFLEKCNGGGKVKDRGWNILRGDGASQVNLAFNLAMQKHDEYVTV